MIHLGNIAKTIKCTTHWDLRSFTKGESHIGEIEEAVAAKSKKVTNATTVLICIAVDVVY